MKKKLLSLITAMSFIIGGAAAPVTVVSSGGGSLESAVRAASHTLDNVTGLTVSGTIDARDFRFIRDNLTQLQSLDLSGASIAAYTGAGGTDCIESGGSSGVDVAAAYDANEIPKMALYKRWLTGTGFNTVTNEVKLANLTTLVLPTTITAVGSYAFSKTGITSIAFPEGVQTIGEKSLIYCTGLQSVSFPASLTALLGTSSSFFEGCLDLNSVTFAEPAHITAFPHWLFGASSADLQLPNLLTVTVPSSVTDVSDAFSYFQGTAIGCDAGNTTYYSDGVVLYKKADDLPVAVPRGITSFTVPAALTVIPDNMFDGCTKLTGITVNSPLTSIGKRAFYNCPITSFNFPATLTKIGEYAFYGTKLASISMTNNTLLTTMERNAFANIGTLSVADLSGLNVLGQYMFSMCESLTGVALSDNLQEIPANAFSGCANLVTLSIPNNVTAIASQAFMSCGKLKNVNLPTSLVALGAQAFLNDTLITQLALPASFRIFTIDANSGNPLTSTYAQITVAAANPYFSAENGLLFNKAKNRLYHVPLSRTRKELIIPAGVDTIGAHAFRTTNNRNYYKVTLPSSVKHIENYGMHGAAIADTFVVKATVPPTVGNTSYSLNNRWASVHPAVLIPARTKAKYKVAQGWSYYYDPTGATGTPHDALIQQSGFYDLGGGMAIAVSPDGNNIVGNGTSGAYIFSSGQQTQIPGATGVADVNDKGFIAGTFVDYSYLYNGNPIENAGVYRNGQWLTLGLGRHGSVPSSSEAHSDVQAIDSVGNVYGSSFLANSVAKVVPFTWKYNAANNNYTTDTLAYATPVSYAAGDQGGKIYDVSSDGTIAGGWISRMIYGGARSAIAWSSPTAYRLFDEDNWSESKAVSPNGRYITATVAGRAAVYDAALDSLIVFGPDSSSPTSVSDNGFVIGFHQRGAAFESGRQGFVWSEKLGLTYLRDFIDQYAPDAEIPSGDFFNFPKEEAIYDTPMSISADGLVIAGWSGYSAIATHGWLLCLADTLNLIDRPRNLSATVDIARRNVVNLSWNAPQDYGTHTLDLYFIYRDGVKIGEIEPYEGTSYTDNNAPTGKVSYTVAAIFDYVNSTTYTASSQTEPASVSIVDNYDVPFAETFESGTFDDNYWTADAQTSSAWLLQNYTGFNGMKAVTLLGSGNQTPYNLSLTSKPFDATGQSKVILAYVYAVLSDAERFLGVKDTVYVEVGVNGAWTKVNTLLIAEKYGWTPATIDISTVAANQLFRVRFRGVSGDNRTSYNYRVDDFGIAFEESAAPSGVLAYRYSGEKDVNVLYKDVTGSYGLSYTNGYFDSSVGNEGNSIIAVNRYTPKQLKKLAGKYLSSISAFLFSDYAGTTVPSEFKLAVFVNGTRVEDAAISAWNGHVWNNFPLTNPVAITGNEEILVGIEAAHGDAYNRPLSMNSKADAASVNPDADLYSEDGGAHWGHASAASIFGHWGITANFRDESAPAPADDDLFDALYEIYRNGEKMESLHYGQQFVDTTSLSDADVYAVKVFRSTGGMSPLSAQSGAIDILLDVPAVKIGQFAVYPNPAKDVVVISADFTTVKVYDISGRLLKQTADRQLNISDLAAGTYLFEIKLADGQKATVKVVKE
ncbi:MAG: leucine-rich repeat domain-containing protein [Prevotella sp.]|jgi:hypothetical protein|nr:leucine-rich repeat domain-containing protein [Prevotella sp.]